MSRHLRFIAVLAGMLAALELCLAQNYKHIEVEAPFKMPRIAVFQFPQKDFPITQYGAIPEGNGSEQACVAANTKAFQRAMKACNKLGGGRIVVPAGVWPCGPIHFKSNCNLFLSDGAIIRFTDNPSAYLPAVEVSWEGLECMNYSPLVYAFQCENIAISGKGRLAPRMDTWRKWFGRPKEHLKALAQLYDWGAFDYPVKKRQMAVGANNLRPHLIHFNQCRNVLLKDFEIRESPFWTIHLYRCDGGLVSGLDVFAHGHNNDGIDIEMTKNLLVENCLFDQGDDAVVIKAGRNRDAWRVNCASENIVVRNCRIKEGHVLLGCGSELSASIRRVYMHDCVVEGEVKELLYLKTNRRRGGVVENITMERIKANKARRTFAIDTDVLYQWASLPTYKDSLTLFRNITMNAIECRETNAVYDINGDELRPIEGVVLRNINVERLNNYMGKAKNVRDLITEGIRCNQGPTLVSGVPWFDQNQNVVNSHGSCIVKEGNRYWLFGEYKSDSTNAFPGFACYSSNDLVNWQFERVVLPVQKSGILGPNRVGERVKVMKCPSTGEFVMLAHADNMSYTDPHVAIATCKSINGDYLLRGTLEYKGRPIKRWDMGTFQDEDGKGYLLIHHGPIYRLADNYLSVDTMVANVAGMGESPTMFKKNGVYFLLTSNLTSWERNDNYYFTATNIKGPWTRQGLFCPEGSLTWNSQCTFVFPQVCKPQDTPMYMGDRWSYPHQASAATNVWLPMSVDGTKLSIPEYWQAWDATQKRPVDLYTRARERKQMVFASDKKDDSCRIKFNGSQIALVGEAAPNGSYALVSIQDDKGNKVFSSLVDFYSKRPDKGVRFLSPVMPKGNYEMTVNVTGERTNWTDKSGHVFGTSGSFVSVSEVLVFY